MGDCAHDRADPRRPRYCRKCSSWKPERTHHCSVSGRCILKMDHYCLWVVNCVGLLNYKFFLLFLAYTWTACLLSVGILAPDLVEYFEGHKRWVVGGKRTAPAHCSVVFGGLVGVSLYTCFNSQMMDISTVSKAQHSTC